MKNLFVFLLALLPLASQAAQPRPPGTITKTEIRTAPPEQTHRRLRNLTWEMFEQEDMRRERAPRRPLDDAWLRTRPRATEVPGLCRYDSVHFEFAPLSRRDRGADTPVRPVGLTAQSFFRFSRPPSADYREISDFERLPEADGCPLLETDRLNFFSAPDAEVATEAYLAFLNLKRSLRERPNLPLTCNLFPNDTLPCEAILLSLDTDAVDSVERCEADDLREICYRAYLGDRMVRMFVTGHVSPGPPAGQMVRAELHGMIVMSHERID